MALIGTTYTGLDVIELDVLTTRQIRNIADINNNELIFRDNYSGKFSASIRRLFPSMEMEFELVLLDRDDVDEFKTFFDTRKGRRVPFYMPTWSEDIVMTDDYNPAGNVLTIRDIDYNASFLGLEARRLLIFMNPSDDEYSIQRISAASTIADDKEELTLQNPGLPAGKRDSDYWEIICFLNYCRLAQDGVDIIWVQDDAGLSSNFATVRLRIKVLENLSKAE